MIEDKNNKTENSAINTDEITRSRDRILNRFSINFTKKRNIKPMYCAVYTMLQQGVDEYRIIEELLQKNEKLSDDMVKLQEHFLTPKYYKDGRE